MKTESCLEQLDELDKLIAESEGISIEEIRARNKINTEKEMLHSAIKKVHYGNATRPIDELLQSIGVKCKGMSREEIKQTIQEEIDKINGVGRTQVWP